MYVLLLFTAKEVDGRQVPEQRSTTRRTKVLILGAGIEGIVAAKTLQVNGINDFLILKAQDYIGGLQFQTEIIRGSEDRKRRQLDPLC